MRFSELPVDDPLRIKIEKRVLEVHQQQICKQLTELRELSSTFIWFKGVGKLGIEQPEFAKRVLFTQLSNKVKQVNEAIAKLYGDEPLE